MTVPTLIQQQLPRCIELRHAFHQIPELGYQEFKTAQAIRAELDRLGIPYVAGVAAAPTATIAWIGDTSRPCIALRADIDALPITERTGTPYASHHEGSMHACGHDGHITTLLGTAAVLKQLIDAGQLNCCVKLMWQPAEEGGGGAKRLVDAGVLDGRLGPKVSAVFGLHGWPGLKVGMVATRPGPLLAATDTFEVTMVGRGCHAAFPHFGCDPIVAAAETILNLQQFIARETDPTEPAVVTVGTIHGGTAENVIPQRVTFTGTARTLTPEMRIKIRRSLQRRCEHVAQACGCEARFTWEEGYPPTINDPAMTDHLARAARSAVGADRFFVAPRPVMGGEDFAYYLEKVPGCFFFVGVEPLDRDTYPNLHSDTYDFTDATIAIGMSVFVEVVRTWQIT